MTDRHDADANAPGHAGAVGHHEPTDHGEEPGEDHGHDDHGHAEAALGPLDVAAWGAGLLGIAISVVIAACFVIATSVPG